MELIVALSLLLSAPVCRAGDWDWRAGLPTTAPSVPAIGEAREVSFADTAQKISPLELHPTQMAVGMREVEEKADKLKSMGREDRRAFLRERPIPAVRGPKGILYIIDHHHLARAAYAAGVDNVYVGLKADWSSMSPSDFWPKMEAAKWVYPVDAKGRRHEVSDLPADVRGLADDPCRSVAWAVREDGGFSKTGAPFAEFQWADFFRARLKDDPSEHFKKAVEEAAKLAKDPSARSLPGYLGR